MNTLSAPRAVRRAIARGKPGLIPTIWREYFVLMGGVKNFHLVPFPRPVKGA